MNRLSIERRAAVIGCITEGLGVNATCRITNTAKNTLLRLVRELGEAAQCYVDGAFQNLDVREVQCDEIWSFCSAKDRHVPADKLDDPNYGSVWLWTAIDAEHKAVVSWWLGERTTEDAYMLLSDLRSRLLPGQRIQLSTDGLGCYPPVVDALWRGNVDYGQVVKEYGGGNEDHKYSPATCTSIQKIKVCGEPDEAKVNTSYVERHNLTIRMSNRRYTRLTNAHSKKLANHHDAIALNFAHYNLCRVHETLTKEAGRKTTPAMALGVERAPWSITQLCELLESK